MKKCVKSPKGGNNGYGSAVSKCMSPSPCIWTEGKPHVRLSARGNITEHPAYDECHPECQFPQITALGDSCGIVATGIRNYLENGSEEDETAEMLASEEEGEKV